MYYRTSRWGFWLLLAAGCAPSPPPPAPPAPVRPTAAPPEFRLELKATKDAAPTPGPASTDEVWEVPRTATLLVHLRDTDPSASANLVDDRGQPIPERTSLYSVGDASRLEIEPLDSPPPNAKLLIKSATLERTIRVRFQ